MSADPITIEFDNELAEHLAADRLHYRSTLWWKVDKVVAVALAAFASYATVTVGPRWWTLIFFALAVVEWFNLLSPRPLQIRFYFKRNPKFSERYRLAFSEDGIDFKTPSLDSRIAWTHYTRVLESDALVLLMYGTRMYSVIPKRAFSDDKQRDRFLELARRHVGSGVAAGHR